MDLAEQVGMAVKERAVDAGRAGDGRDADLVAAASADGKEVGEAEQATAAPDAVSPRIVRLLVQAGPEGLPAGEIAERLGVQPTRAPRVAVLVSTCLAIASADVSNCSVIFANTASRKAAPVACDAFAYQCVSPAEFVAW